MKSYIDLLSGHLSSTWNALCAFCLAKGCVGAVLGVLWYLLGADNKAAVGALLVLIAFDLATALWAAYKTGVAIESRRIFKSASKLVIYLLFISAGHLTSVILGDFTIVQYGVASFLALTEFISIMENIGKMGYMVPQKLLNRLQELRDTK